MKIRVKYFGLIAEKTGCLEEKIELSESISLAEFHDFIKSKYNLGETPFRIAVNQSFDDKLTALKNTDEVALLPPFAGG